MSLSLLRQKLQTSKTETSYHRTLGLVASLMDVSKWLKVAETKTLFHVYVSFVTYLGSSIHHLSSKNGIACPCPLLSKIAAASLYVIGVNEVGGGGAQWSRIENCFHKHWNVKKSFILIFYINVHLICEPPDFHRLTS